MHLGYKTLFNSSFIFKANAQKYSGVLCDAFDTVAEHNVRSCHCRVDFQSIKMETPRVKYSDR